MKICQTLWTCHKDLLSDSFGWLSPQHHLIAWAYSCLKLKELYPNVEFYTDFHGAEVFIDILKLPYSNIHVEYDNLRYNPSLWALPKVLTYGKQQQPFIHVDGDVFVFEKFNDELENARLVAQNQEVSTESYRKSFEPIIKKVIYTPELFKENLFAKYPKAYNAGILGGSDIELMKQYVSESVRFVEENYAVHSNVNFNIIFEQLMFYSVAQANDVEVRCLFDKTFDDHGYSMDQFGDFLSFPKLKYLHLIGALKKSEFVCNQLAKHLFHEYPDYFLQIASLFKSSHYHSSYFLKEDNFEPSPTKAFKYDRTRVLVKKIYPKANLRSNKDLFSFVKTKNNPTLSEVLKYEQRIHYVFEEI